MSQQKDTFTLIVQNGSLETAAMFDDNQINGADMRLQQQVELVQDVVRWLPDLRAVWSVHDTPSSIISYQHRAELIERVEDNDCECGPSSTYPHHATNRCKPQRLYPSVTP